MGRLREMSLTLCYSVLQYTNRGPAPRALGVYPPLVRSKKKKKYVGIFFAKNIGKMLVNFLFEKCCFNFLLKTILSFVWKNVAPTFSKKMLTKMLATIPKNVDEKLLATIPKNVDKKNVGKPL
jgi:hypothetical protein